MKEESFFKNKRFRSLHYLLKTMFSDVNISIFKDSSFEREPDSQYGKILKASVKVKGFYFQHRLTQSLRIHSIYTINNYSITKVMHIDFDLNLNGEEILNKFYEDIEKELLPKNVNYTKVPAHAFVYVRKLENTGSPPSTIRYKNLDTDEIMLINQFQNHIENYVEGLQKRNKLAQIPALNAAIDSRAYSPLKSFLFFMDTLTFN